VWLHTLRCFLPRLVLALSFTRFSDALVGTHAQSGKSHSLLRLQAALLHYWFAVLLANKTGGFRTFALLQHRECWVRGNQDWPVVILTFALAGVLNSTQLAMW
jgi:hypothetical protein